MGVDTTAIPTLMDMDTVLDTEDTMVDTTATDTELTVMLTITARGPLMPNLRLKLKPIPHTCMLVPMATPMLMVPILMDTDTELSPLTTLVALASNMFPPVPPPMVSLNSTKDPLMPNPRLMLMPLTTMVDTTATPDTTDTVTDTVSDTAVTMVVTDTVVSATTDKLLRWRN